MKRFILTCLIAPAVIATANFAQAGWYYWDHGRLMWANKYGYVEDVAQVEAELAQQALQDKLDEIKSAIEDLQGGPVESEPKPSKGLGYKFVPVHPKEQTPVCTP